MNAKYMILELLKAVKTLALTGQLICFHEGECLNEVEIILRFLGFSFGAPVQNQQESSNLLVDHVEIFCLFCRLV